MIRALVIVIVAGFLMSVVCISAAIAIGGPDALGRRMWNLEWEEGPHHFVWRNPRADTGPEAQRDFPWPGGDRLEVNAPAEIEYVQAPGPAKLTIRGPAAQLDHVRVEGGRITAEPAASAWRRLHVTLSAPGVSRFVLNGADTLRIRAYNQDQLSVAVNGHGEVEAEGQTKSVNLSLTGAGEADLSDLKTAGAAIDISGAGSATVGPTDWARLKISGVGDVELLTHPGKLETHISGAGRVRQPGEDSDSSDDSDQDDDDDARGPPRAA
jgi:hypothetical protein